MSIPFWLVNKSGIPLIFKREEDDQEAAGQFEEHERARSLTPLPFSFVSSEYLFTCQMRVGKYYHVTHHALDSQEGSTAAWCRAFNFEKEFDRRTLYVRVRQSCSGGGERLVEKSFEIGIITKWGKGVFSRTKIVTFVPLFQMVNRTEHTLIVTQRPSSSSNKDGDDSSNELKCESGVSTNFHWSHRWDRLLRVRLHEGTGFSEWSGSFRIDKETTFHVVVKSNRRENIVLQISVTFKNGSYRCAFMSADEFPPPYRIINFSEVPLFYCQTNIHSSPSSSATNISTSRSDGNNRVATTSSSHMREFIRPKECKDYVMEEPLHPHSLTFSVFQEFSETYDLRKHHNGGGSGKSSHGFKKLYYQNAIFVAFTSTFQR